MKNEYAGNRLEGQIEQWEAEISKLQCDYKDATEEEKERCSRKIKDLQIKISDAQSEIDKMKMKK